MTSILGEEKPLVGRFFWYFLIVWVVFGLFQLYYTELNGEESYYWLFSQNLAWGYLDHPPMIGFVSSIGYWLFANNLGVRLGMLVCNVLSIIIIRKTLNVKDDKLYVWLLLSMLPMHAGSLFLKTDVPMLLFEAMFFYFYKKYLVEDSLKNSVLISLSIALMLLSKHLAILVVLFTVMSNINMMKTKSFWLIVGMTTILMLPHSFWMYENNFATINFHLNNRIDYGFSIQNVLYYIGFQPIFFAPFTGVLLFAACYKNKVESKFNRALKFTMVGVLLLFLASTFKVEFHKHWTSILGVPMVLLSYEYIATNKKLRFWVIRLSQIPIILGVIGGIYLMYDFFPKNLTKDWDINHNWDSWGEEVKELSKGLPVVFINHYERAARYSYLVKEPVLSYNSFDYRETQHDLWSLEDDLQGQAVFIIDRHNRDQLYPTYLTTIGKGIHYRVEESFRSFRKVSISLKDGVDLDVKVGEVLSLGLELKNNYTYDVNFSDVNEREVDLMGYFLDKLSPVTETRLEILTGQIDSGSVISKSVKIRVPEVPGKYDLRFSIKVEGIEAPINSQKYSISVK